jgi:hypothetical protein
VEIHADITVSLDPEHRHLGQTDQQLAHLGGIGLQR